MSQRRIILDQKNACVSKVVNITSFYNEIQTALVICSFFHLQCCVYVIENWPCLEPVLEFTVVLAVLYANLLSFGTYLSHISRETCIFIKIGICLIELSKNLT